jgi:calcineurin-like phosphoesterase
MRILFLGDVMGRSGREGVKAHLPALQKAYGPDVVIVNAENASSGRGITMKQAGEFFALGVDCLTMGNHVWNQKELLQKIGEEPRIVRPLNYPKGTPGQGFYLHTLPGRA